MNNKVNKKIDEIYDAIKNKAERIRVDDYHETYHKKCVSFVTLDGLWLEFGVYRGRSIMQFAKQTNNIIYGFDSFEGLPEFWDSQNPKGVYSLGGKMPIGAICGSNDNNPGMYSSEPTKTIEPWLSNIQLIKGWFDESLPKFLLEHKEPVSFLHIDSDLYSSCKTVLSLLSKQIIHGSIIAFDEIVDYPDFKQHEIKAFAEFLTENNHLDYNCLIHQDVGMYSQACFEIINREKYEKN